MATKQGRSYLVALTIGRRDRATAVCVDDGDNESKMEVKLFKIRYGMHEIRRVDYAEMTRLMIQD